MACKTCKHFEPETKDEKSFCWLFTKGPFDSKKNSQLAYATSENGDVKFYVNPNFSCFHWEFDL